MSADYCTRLFSDLSQIGQLHWNTLLAADAQRNVFLRYELLHALHSSGAASPRSGWTPQYLTLWQRNELVAAAPLYLKAHSYGEYVFDWAWADAYARYGMDYYPKWLSAVPFTPVPGTRLIARDEAARLRLIDALLAHVQEAGHSSLHLLFTPPAQAELLAKQGFLIRQGVQFHWRNGNESGTRYSDFEEFLAQLAQPKRKKIRAERRKVADAGVSLERKVGQDITQEDWRFFYRCYCATYAAHGSPPYLNLDFFLRLAQTLPEHLLLVIANQAGHPIAASLGVFDERLYGRYWGALADVPCLHFEACYYQMIEFAIERGLTVFEGGAQGAHKLARGLDPVPTYSAHWIADCSMRAAIARFVERETDSVEHTIDELNEHRAFKTNE